MLKNITQRIHGFGTMIAGDIREDFISTTDEYANDQAELNEGKARSYILPYIQQNSARRIVDLGCGVGAMVKTLSNEGYDAYGVDLITLCKYWERLGLEKDRFFVVDPYKLELPFEDQSIDFAFSLGVIEHIGTSNGHSDRLDNYHAIRQQWLREVFRIIKPGGCMLIGGPNRNFPIDTAHGPDSRAGKLELRLSGLLGSTVHKTWGENFLWGYSDIARYLEGLPYKMQPQSIQGLVHFSRVPKPLRGLSTLYTHKMPKFLLGTGFNPWMMALIKRY
jgi:SAM-dependent methyltransferase